MYVENLKYDPVRDKAPVDQYGFIDLKSALSESVVPSQLPESDSDYNGIDDPASIVGRPEDVFEAIESQRAFEAASAQAGQESKDE